MSFKVKPEILFIVGKSDYSKESDEILFPPLDMYYAQGTLYLEVEIPGIDPQEVKLILRGRELVIEGNKRDKKNSSLPLSFLRTERFMGPFKRVVALPYPIDNQGIKAVFRKGVLYIQIPIKKEEQIVKIEQED